MATKQRSGIKVRESPARWSASAALGRRLGDQLVKDPRTAFFELVKNAYDADATMVEVAFGASNDGAQHLQISDDGAGMSMDDINTKWCRLAGENKVREPYTPLFRRRRLGEKGVGRFAVGKLGDRVEVITRKKEQPQLKFRIDFADFTDDRDLQDIEMPIKSGQARRGFANGTVLKIDHLRKRWTKRDAGTLRNQLSSLIDPESSDRNFQIKLNYSEWPDLSGALESPLSGQESHRLEFAISESGKYRCKLHRGDELLLSIKEDRKRLDAGPVKGTVRYFRDGVKRMNRRLGADDSHLGIKVYRDSCRVRPYGEPTDDWLRLRSPRKPSTTIRHLDANSIAGSVYITRNDNPDLTDDTSREGMIRNEAFQSFAEFVGQQVAVLGSQLSQEIRSGEARRKKLRVEKILNTVVTCLNGQASNLYDRKMKDLDRGHEGEHGEKAKPERPVVDVKPTTKATWRCIACDTRWRVLKSGSQPTTCLELAVDREGNPRDVVGCGSNEIERAKNEPGEARPRPTSIVSGDFALIGNRMLKVRVDTDLGPKDDEFRVEEREIVINGNHVAYRVAERLDRNRTGRPKSPEEAYQPAQTIHIVKCVCLAWAHFHYEENRNWEDYRHRYEELQELVCERVIGELRDTSTL